MSPATRFLLSCSLLLAACSGSSALHMADSTDVRTFARDRTGGSPGSDLSTTRFREGLCEGESLMPDNQPLTEADLIRYLERQNLDVRVDRARADLVYLFVSGAGTTTPVRMRVAILESADKAGRELLQAVLQHGPGSWGVHRSNIAVLGPAADPEDALAFAGKAKLQCWGVFTMAGRDDAFVVPGGYTEI